MNLNNTPSAGPLTAADLTLWRRTGSTAGVEQPQPAEASTDIGADDGDAVRGFVIALPAALVAWAVIAAGAVTFKFWPQIAALFT